MALFMASVLLLLLPSVGVCTPTGTPTALPTLRPSGMPTLAPSGEPSSMPSSRPTNAPTVTFAPSPLPTLPPTAVPSLQPTNLPTQEPSLAPTSVPTATPAPSGPPSLMPTSAPSLQPSSTPTVTPVPTALPTLIPSSLPSMHPTSVPTASPVPSAWPSLPPIPAPTQYVNLVSTAPSDETECKGGASKAGLSFSGSGSYGTSYPYGCFQYYTYGVYFNTQSSSTACSADFTCVCSNGQMFESGTSLTSCFGTAAPSPVPSYSPPPTTTFAPSVVRTEQFYVLSRLYKATGGDSSWAAKANWMNLESNPCDSSSWYGVTCTGDVMTALDVSANKLNGSLPTELGLLSNLEAIYVNDNQLGGSTVPTELGQMSLLTGPFNLYTSDIGGTAPSELAHFTALTIRLNLLSNSMTGTIPTQYGKMTSMRNRFNLPYNSFSGTIPTELGRLSLMDTYFLVRYNKFTGTIPTQLGSMTALTISPAFDTNSFSGTIPTEIGLLSLTTSYVYFHDNSFAGTIPTELGGMTALTKGPAMGDNSFTGSLPTQLARLSRVNEWFASFRRNSLTGTIATEFGQLADYSDSFEFFQNKFSGTIPSQLGNMLLERFINVGLNSLTGTIPSELGSTSNYHVFSVQGNSLTGTVPTELGLLSAHTKYFVLADNYITGTVPTELHILSKSQAYFKLENNRLSGTLPTQFGTFTAMYNAFGLNQNDFHGTIPSQFGMLSAMSNGMELFENGLTASLPTEFGQLTGIVEQLDVFENFLTGTLPTQIGECKALTYGLNLHSNRFSSALPSELGSLSSFKSGARLQSNSFTGVVPTEIGFLTALTTGLYLQSNLFSMRIPSELGFLSSSLKGSVDFGSNNITESLPTQIGFLANLEEYFVVSDNGIVGQIPSQIGSWAKFSSLVKFSNNKITGELPTEIGKLGSAREIIKFNSNKITGGVPTQLGGLVALQDFNVADNSMTGSLPSQIASMLNLTSIYLQENHLEGHFPSEFGKLSDTLTTFVGSSNNFEGSVESWLCNFESLKVFLMGSNSLQGSLPQCNFPNLTSFAVNNNRFRGSLPSFDASPKLQNVLLHENTFDDKIRKLIKYRSSKIDDLRVVTLHGNRLEGSLPAWYSFPSSIEVFTLFDNNIDGRLPEHLLAPQNSTNTSNATGPILLMHGNQLSCEPPKFGGISAAEGSVVLAGNQFSKGKAALPRWIPKAERSASFLYTVIEPTWLPLRETSLPMWLQFTMEISAMLLIASPSVFYFMRRIVTNFRRPTAVTQQLLRLAIAVASLAAGLSCCAYPIFVLGANFFECGDQFLKYTTIAYISNSASLEWACAVAICAYTAAISFILLRYYIPARDIEAGRDHTFLSGLISMCFPGRRRQQERAEAVANMFDVLDENDDGELSLEEVLAGAHRLGMTVDEATKLFQDLDVNGDGTLSREEFAAPLGLLEEAIKASSQSLKVAKGWLAHFVKNCYSERRLRQERAQAVAHLFDVLDENDDGELSLEEVLAGAHRLGMTVDEATKLFQDLDVNGDGTLSREEFDAPLGIFEEIISASIITQIIRAIVGRIFAAVYFGAWLCTMAVMNAPTVLYVMTHSLPVDNSLNFSLTTIDLLYYSLGFILLLVSGVGIPTVSRLAAWAIVKAKGRSLFTNSSPEDRTYALTSALVLTARTMTVLIVPVVAVVIFGDGCRRNWLMFWDSCDSSHRDVFDISTELTFEDGFENLLEVESRLYSSDSWVKLLFFEEVERKTYSSIDVKVLSSKAVCEPSYSTGTCARSVVSLVGPLLLAKIVYSIAFASLGPALLSVLMKLVRGLNGPEPDPQTRLLHVEPCLVFGFVVPLLVPLLAFQLCMDGVLFEWFAKKAPSATQRGGEGKLNFRYESLRFQSFTILALQSGLGVWFFIDNDLKGSNFVMVALPLIFVAALTLHASGMITPARILGEEETSDVEQGREMQPLPPPSFSPSDVNFEQTLSKRLAAIRGTLHSAMKGASISLISRHCSRTPQADRTESQGARWLAAAKAIQKYNRRRSSSFGTVARAFSRSRGSSISSGELDDDDGEDDLEVLAETVKKDGANAAGILDDAMYQGVLVHLRNMELSAGDAPRVIDNLSEWLRFFMLLSDLGRGTAFDALCTAAALIMRIVSSIVKKVVEENDIISGCLLILPAIIAFFIIVVVVMAFLVVWFGVVTVIALPIGLSSLILFARFLYLKRAIKISMKEIRGIGEEINSSGIGTLLHVAAESNRMDCVQLLLDAGADARTLDTTGRTAADAAPADSEAAEALRSAIAEANSRPAAHYLPLRGDQVRVAEPISKHWIRGTLVEQDGHGNVTVETTDGTIHADVIKLRSESQWAKYNVEPPDAASNGVSLRLIMAQLHALKGLSRLERYNRLSGAFPSYLPPMVVASYESLELFGKMAHSRQGHHVSIDKLPDDAIVIFFSQTWLRGKQTATQSDDGSGGSGLKMTSDDITPNPDSLKGEEDDASRRYGTGVKAQQMLQAMKYIAEKRRIDKESVFAWYDFSCVDQEESYPWPFMAAINALPIYLALCDCFVCSTVDAEGGRNWPYRYENRIWCRLEMQASWFCHHLMHANDEPWVKYQMDDVEQVQEKLYHANTQPCVNPATGAITKEVDRGPCVLMSTLFGADSIVGRGEGGYQHASGFNMRGASADNSSGEVNPIRESEGIEMVEDTGIVDDGSNFQSAVNPMWSQGRRAESSEGSEEIAYVSHEGGRVAEDSKVESVESEQVVLDRPIDATEESGVGAEEEEQNVIAIAMDEEAVEEMVEELERDNEEERADSEDQFLGHHIDAVDKADMGEKEAQEMIAEATEADGRIDRQVVEEKERELAEQAENVEAPVTSPARRNSAASRTGRRPLKRPGKRAPTSPGSPSSTISPTSTLSLTSPLSPEVGNAYDTPTSASYAHSEQQPSMEQSIDAAADISTISTEVEDACNMPASDPYEQSEQQPSMEQSLERTNTNLDDEGYSMVERATNADGRVDHKSDEEEEEHY